MKNYKQKIYKYYSSNGGVSLVPKSIEELHENGHFYSKVIKNFFPEDKKIKILEIGCGYGGFQYFIKNAGYTNSLGIDGSEEQVVNAKKLGIDNVVLEDLVKYIANLESDSLDLLIAIDVIEHFSKDELSDLILECHRVMKKSALMITHQPNAESIFVNAVLYGDYTHELAFTRRSISQLFFSNNFSEIRCYEDAPIIHGIKSAVRYFLWQYFVRPIYRFLLLVESGGSDKDTILSQNFLVVAKK